MVHRHAARVGGTVLVAGVAAIALAGGRPTDPLEAIGVALLASAGLLVCLGGFLGSVSVGPVTVPWYGSVGAGLVGVGLYMLAGALASTGGRSLLWDGLLPALAGLSSCWIGLEYARGSNASGWLPSDCKRETASGIDEKEGTSRRRSTLDVT